MRIANTAITGIKFTGNTNRNIKIVSPKFEQLEVDESHLAVSPYERILDGFDLGRVMQMTPEETAVWRRETFYTKDKNLEGYAPGDRPIEVEITLATYRDFVALDYSKINTQIKGLPCPIAISIAKTLSSPFVFEQQVNNLKTLYEHLGDDAANYTDLFDAALQGVIAEFIHKGGRFIGPDKDGVVADSMRAMFRGEEGTYTADDLKTMAALSFELDTRYHTGDDRSVFSAGVFPGYQALMIANARNAGKLSDAAFQTVTTHFIKNQEYIYMLAEYNLNQLRNNPKSSKQFDYIMPSLDDLKKALNAMLNYKPDDDPNQSLRFAFSVLAQLHNTSLQMRYAYLADSMENLHKIPFIRNDDDRKAFESSITSGNRHFTEFLNKPNLTAISYSSPFDISV